MTVQYSTAGFVIVAAAHVTNPQMDISIMGLGSRIFIIDDDSMTRMPEKRYIRLSSRDPAERFPEYIGRRVCYVLIVEIELLYH